MFRHDADDWIANWREDAVWRISGTEFSGKAAIRAAWTEAMAGYALAGFFATPGALHVDGAEARARVHTQEILVDRAGKVLRVIGVYEDRLVKSEGVWLFAERAYRMLHHEVSG